MTLRTRRVIFYILVALFILIGGGAVFYAQGWRIDFSTWKFEKVGGIYIRAYPQNASIELNGKSIQNQSGFLSPGTLISNLLPKTYRISLQVPGYENWQEWATVAPAYVTQFKYAVLVPASGTPIASATLVGGPAAGGNFASVKEYSAMVATAAATEASTTDPFDATQKIILGENKISLYSAIQATTTATVVVSGTTLEAKWLSSNLIGILQTDGECYVYHVGTQQLQKLADTVTHFSETADGTTMATLERNGLEIFSFVDPNGYYRFNLPNAADAQNIIWYKDMTHLFIVYPDRIAFLDLADSGLTNFVTVAHGTQPYYDPQTNSLYIISAASGKVTRYDFPM